ncbi:hypothetical protein THMIRHAS_07160 [Thiosulfatimonas sediminis]|uniref:Methyltransferase type 12 n=1 Tax=Thiosulfatimonas sediminis TaxID=2675054 RepID=A0A6F8PT83_9GAMM|nr:class I SAM-dependent methyltransferase [Thiosulfatimonas sediminis]BBP45343.1 hypothetical protein THMIRHAS_07160 [Thiosulfatimonas sediminis]
MKFLTEQNFPPIAKALLAQFFAMLLLGLTVFLLAQFVAPPFSDGFLLFLQTAYAVLLTTLFVLPRWWYLIQILLPGGLYLALSAGANPLLALVLFVLLVLVFKNAFLERVPLYLSNQTTRLALAQLARENQLRRFMDLGCGNGLNVRFMAEQPGIDAALGVETAPIPLWIAKLRNLRGGGTVLAQNLWHTSLFDVSLAYAFLSPEPMAKLWQKVLQEMPDQGFFVSNSFAVPSVTPSEIWQLNDRRQTKLYIYKIAEFRGGDLPPSSA